MESDQLLVEGEYDRLRFAPVFNCKSLQPDVVLWQKEELVYQIHLSPSSITGPFYSVYSIKSYLLCSISIMYFPKI